MTDEPGTSEEKDLVAGLFAQQAVVEPPRRRVRPQLVADAPVEQRAESAPPPASAVEPAPVPPPRTTRSAPTPTLSALSSYESGMIKLATLITMSKGQPIEIVLTEIEKDIRNGIAPKA